MEPLDIDAAEAEINAIELDPRAFQAAKDAVEKAFEKGAEEWEQVEAGLKAYLWAVA